jgi:methylated-DNA-protein-cysteine methyltransferase related protein
MRINAISRLGYHRIMARRVRKSMAALLRPLSAPRSRAGRGGTGEDNPALEAIWNVVASIPRGQVSTYGAVARAAGLPGRARQTGFALRVAPEELNLPWHRVLGAGGRIVFPKTSRHFKEQARRLRAEGVIVKDGRAAASSLTELEEL